MQDESTIRLSIFVLVLAVLALWEIAAPHRRAEVPKLVRWSNNIGLLIVDSVLVRLLFPILATGAALNAQANGWGLFPALGLGGPGAVVLAVVALDLAIWAQHLVFHKVPLLWRLHRVHHADPAMDVTTALRFHPLEILLSMAIKIGLVMALGAPAEAVLLFEIILNATALFTHANISLPPALERRVRWVLVTPEMHRIHHSERREETDSNYGFALSIWDRLLGTYRARAHGSLTFGIGRFGTVRDQWLDRLLAQPFRR